MSYSGMNGFFAPDLVDDFPGIIQMKVTRPFSVILGQPDVLIAMLTIVIGQAVVIMVMVITSLHMETLVHLVPNNAIVISAQSFEMFAFSKIAGRLIDRFGWEPVIMLQAVLLILGGMSAGLSPHAGLQRSPRWSSLRREQPGLGGFNGTGIDHPDRSRTLITPFSHQNLHPV